MFEVENRVNVQCKNIVQCPTLATPSCCFEASGEDGSDLGSFTSGKGYLSQRRRDAEETLVRKFNSLFECSIDRSRRK